MQYVTTPEPNFCEVLRRRDGVSKARAFCEYLGRSTGTRTNPFYIPPSLSRLKVFPTSPPVLCCSLLFELHSFFSFSQGVHLQPSHCTN